MNEKKSNVKKITVCGVLSALTVVLLWIGSMTVFDVTAVVIGALVTMGIKIEAGTKWAWLYAGVTGVLSLLLLSSKLLAVEFIVIAGIYPIFKADIEKIPSQILQWLVKISVIDVMFMGEYVLAKLVFTTEETVDLTVVTILLATVFAVVYDFALTVCVSTYIMKIRKKLKLKNLF